MFTVRFVNFAQSHNITAYQIAKATGISQGTMNEYKNGKKTPSIQNIFKIAEYLDCSVDYLLGRTDNPQSHKVGGTVSVGNVSSNNGAIGVGNTVTNNAPLLDEHQKLLLELYNKLSPIEQIELIASLNNGEKKP